MKKKKSFVGTFSFGNEWKINTLTRFDYIKKNSLSVLVYYNGCTDGQNFVNKKEILNFRKHRKKIIKSNG